MSDGTFSSLKAGSIGLVVLAAISLMGIAVVNGFKGTLLIDNTTADLFITALAIFGSFSAILALGIMGRAVIGLFKKGI